MRGVHRFASSLLRRPQVSIMLGPKTSSPQDSGAAYIGDTPKTSLTAQSYLQMILSHWPLIKNAAVVSKIFKKPGLKNLLKIMRFKVNENNQHITFTIK